MIRNVLWLFAGIVLTLAVLYFVLQKRSGARFVLEVFHSPEFAIVSGPNSPIIIVGGSLKLHATSGWDQGPGAPGSHTTVLSKAGTDATEFELLDESGGSMSYSGLNVRWTITEQVRNEKNPHGILIAGTGGTNGTVTVTLLDGGDWFDPSGPDYQYDNPKKSSDCPAGPEECQRDDTMVVTINNVKQTPPFKCTDTSGHCHVYIGK